MNAIVAAFVLSLGLTPPDPVPGDDLETVRLERAAPTESADGTSLDDPAGYRVHRGPPHDVCNHVETQHPNTSSSLDQTVSPGIYDFAVPTSDVFGGENSD